MNDDFLRYKYRFLSFVLLLGYAFLHTQLTGLFSDLSFESLINFSVRLPYGQRLLVPALANLVARILPFTAEELFFLLEWLFISLFYYALYKLLQEEFDKDQARLLSWLFILLLPLITVVNYRFQAKGTAALFYPCDTAALFFITTGFLFCLRSQWLYFIPWVFFATLNRESSILLVLLIPALHWQKLRQVLMPTIFALLVYLLARFLVLQFLADQPGPLWELYPRGQAHSNFIYNLAWLINSQNIILFVFCFAGLPVFWFAFFDYIPLQFRPIRYLALFNFLVLLMVGRFMETRIFSEIAILLYLPVCLALKNWLSQIKPIRPATTGMVYYVDRYLVLGILLMLVILYQYLIHFVI